MYIIGAKHKFIFSFIGLLAMFQAVLGGEAFRDKMIKGHKHLRAGEYGPALLQFNGALALRPGNPIALKNCAKAFAGTGNWRAAEDIYLKYLAKTAKAYSARHYRNSLSSLTDTERLLKILGKLYDINKKDLQFGLIYIEAMRRHGRGPGSPDYQKAVETLAELPDIPGSVSDALYEMQKAELTAIQTRKKLSKERDSYFWKAVLAINRWEPMEIDTLYMSGLLKGAMNRYPSEKRFAQAWVTLQFHQKKFDAIEAAIRKLPQSDIKVRRMLAEMAFHKKKYADAIRHWHHVPRHEINQTEWEHLCQALAETGKRREAMKEYGELYMVFPTSNAAKKYLKRLN